MSQEKAAQMSGLQVLLFAVSIVGFMLFAAGLFVGMGHNPHFNMHGRLVAYSAAMFGLTLGFGCRYAMLEIESAPRISRLCYGIATLIAFAMFWQVSSGL